MSKESNTVLSKLKNPILATDSYKFSHFDQMPEGITKLYSHLTPRNNHYLKQQYLTSDDKVVAFGMQYVIKLIDLSWDEYFFSKPWEEVGKHALNVLAPHMGYTENNMLKFKALHELGYLPLEFKTIEEGNRVNIGIPLLTVTNTHPEFHWLPNFLEPKIIANTYPAVTIATASYELAKLRNKYFEITSDNEVTKSFIFHDFSFRGQQGDDAATAAIIAYTLITSGTDTVTSIPAVQEYYNIKDMHVFSLPAAEHSVASTGIAYYGPMVYEVITSGADNTTAISLLANLTKLNMEIVSQLYRACCIVYKNDYIRGSNKETLIQVLGETFNLGRMLTAVYPTGLYAYVSDTYDYWRVLEIIVPALKEIITNREGKLILRPDCYSEDTQVLTNRGFVFFKDLIETDKIAQVLDDGSYEFVKPLKIVNEPYKGKMYHFKDHFGKVDQLVTPNHRMIYKQINPSNHSVITEKVIFAEKMKKTGNGLNYFERSAKAQNRNKTLTDLEKLNIAFQADGSYSTGCNNSIRFSFSKERKIERLSTLLINMKLPFKIYDLKDGKKEFNITISKNLMHKDFNWIDISNLCSNWCQEFLEELKHWDSSIRNAGRFKYDTTTKSCSSIVELIAVSAGKGVFTTESEDNREKHFSNVFTSHIMDNNKAGGKSWVKEEVYYDGTIHCVQVPTGRLIVKRNRSIMVCGNSGNPVKILCGNHQGQNEAERLGTVEYLSNVFGYTLNTKGYKVLDSHIGVVYGDGMNYNRIEAIFDQLSIKGFDITNVCLACGAYMLSSSTRDSLGFAIKASAVVINDVTIPVYKQPKTDLGKISPKGLLKVVKDSETGEYSLIDNVSWEEEKESELKTIYLNGEFINEITYDQVKARLFS